MKKTLNVNLNGCVFTIDEDAYTLLDNYLSNLRICFRKEEGASDIIADFEARIEELFREKTRLGYQIITFEHVEEVIARVGRPADFADRDEKDAEQQTNFVEPGKVKKKFYRNVDNKLLGGVCSGIAAYFNWSAAAVRVIVFLAPFVIPFLRIFSITYSEVWGAGSRSFSFFFPIWILAYIIIWIIVPGARTAEQKLQMHGKPITVENIGKTVAAQSTPDTSKKPNGCLEVIVVFLKIALVGLGCLIGIPLLILVFVIVIVAFFGLSRGFLGLNRGFLGNIPSFLFSEHPVLATITGVIVIGIPVVVLIYVIIAHFKKAKPMNQPVKWTLLIIWILAFVLFLFSGFRISYSGFRIQSIGGHPVWNQSITSEKNKITGNSIPSQKTIHIDGEVKYVDIYSNLCANIQIEQTEDEMPSIEISGDENLVELVSYQYHDKWLNLLSSSLNKMQCDNNLNITLRTNDLSRILMRSTGFVRINQFRASDLLDIKIMGTGNFYADSLYAYSLRVTSEGVGSADITGKAHKTHFEVSGTGKIDAMELLSDSVYAQVNGVGAIHCFPVNHLEGHVRGVGSIIYKEEPVSKKCITLGVGKIKKR